MVEPATIGLTGSAEEPVWGVVMDSMFAEAEGWHCLVALADGSTSLYTSAAFGIIGGGAHETVRAASRDLLALTGQRLDLFSPMADTALPSGGMVTIRALTFGGPLVVTATENDLGNGRHPASPIFHAAHDVIGQLRMVSEPGPAFGAP